VDREPILGFKLLLFNSLHPFILSTSLQLVDNMPTNIKVDVLKLWNGNFSHDVLTTNLLTMMPPINFCFLFIISSNGMVISL
jgi:hypothetical protein